MKYFYCFIALLLSVKVNSQIVDTDGDGIPDDKEITLSKPYMGQIPFATYNNKLLADFPGVFIRFSDVRIGLRFTLTNKTTETAKIQNSSETDNSSTVTRKTYNSESISNSLTATVKASYGLTGLSTSVSIEDQFKVSSENSFSYTKSDVDEYKKQFSEIQTKENSNILSIDASAGYVSTTIYFYNPDPVRTVTISKVRIHIVEFDNNGIRNDQNITDDFLVKLVAGIDGVTPSSISASDNILVLPPHQSVPVNVNLEKLNSYEIDKLIRNNIHFGFELVPPYELEFSDSKASITGLKLSEHADDINNSCFSMRVVDSVEDRNVLVAKTDGGSAMTLRKALGTLYPDPGYIKFETLNLGTRKIVYLKRLGNITSDLDLTLKPDQYSEENKNQGFWFVLTSYSKDLYVNLEDPVIDPLNAHPFVAIVYVKGRDLLSASYIPSAPVTVEATGDATNISTGLQLSSDDLVEIKVNTQQSNYSTIKTKVPIVMPPWPPVNFGPGSVNKFTTEEGWQSCDDISTLDKLHFSLYLDQLGQEFFLSDCKIIDKYYNKDTLVLRLKPNAGRLFTSVPLTIKSYYNLFTYGQVPLREGYDGVQIIAAVNQWSDIVAARTNNLLSQELSYLPWGLHTGPFGIDGKPIKDLVDQNPMVIHNIKKKASITVSVLRKKK